MLSLSGTISPLKSTKWTALNLTCFLSLPLYNLLIQLFLASFSSLQLKHMQSLWLNKRLTKTLNHLLIPSQIEAAFDLSFNCTKGLITQILSLHSIVSYLS